MEPYLELIHYIAPPAIYFKPVPETGRRRLFGGDYPGEFVGDSFRIFGGHDYGYIIPRTAYGGDMTQIRKMTKMNTFIGFAVTFALAVGNVMLPGAKRGFIVFAFFLIANEVYSYWLSSGAKGLTYQQLLAEYTQLEKTGGLGLDAGNNPQLAVKRYLGLQQGETRFVSGSSMVYGALAGYAIARTGLVLKDAYFWPPFGGRNAVLSYQIGNVIMINNVWMWAQEKRSGIKTGMAHDKHFKWMAFGYVMGYFNLI